ncbi:MAG: hypothetical protein GX171_00435 [Clostridiales bacterium]|jgi:predicted MPP superfamily phosphohydrolase|nr:hypothetical protein [Clostridiales bacterium]
MSNRRSSRLFRPRRKRRAGCVTVFVLFLLAVVLVFAFNAFANRYVRLDQQSVTVLNLPKAYEGYTILHVSDLNAATLGNHQENLMNTLGKEAFDAVVMTGDMVGTSGKAQPMLDLIAQLAPKAPVFFVTGDADPSPLLSQPHGDGEVKAAYIQQAEALGATYLEVPLRLETNEQVLWYCPGEAFTLDLQNAVFALSELEKTLLSSENPYEAATSAQLRHTQHRKAIMEQTMALMKTIAPTDTVIAVMHQPPTREELAEIAGNAREQGLPVPALFLAGQYNNGQARLPGLGPIYVPRLADGPGGYFPGDEGLTGLQITQGVSLHISPGLGASSYYPIPLRLFNRPAMTLIHLTQKMTR